MYAHPFRASKPAPVATEEFTSSLEELIIQRIKDEKFDDVIPREKPDEIDLSVRDAPELSQEKSKMGLGDVSEYEISKIYLFTICSSVI
jgi:U3 small nucleolar RNA-associated protein MPP10